MSEPQCYLGVQLDTQRHKLRFCWSTGTVKLTELEKDIQEILLWRAGLWGHQELFRNVFERSCGVLGSHQRRVKSKIKQITILMTKELKAKGYNVIPGHSLCCQCIKNMIISRRVIRMNQMLSRTKNLMTTHSKYQGSSSIPSLRTINTIDLVLTLYEDDECSLQMPGKKH